MFSSFVFPNSLTADACVKQYRVKCNRNKIGKVPSQEFVLSFLWGWVDYLTFSGLTQYNYQSCCFIFIIILSKF